jgi:hypothetical protein
MIGVVTWMILTASTSVAGPPPAVTASATLGFPPITGYVAQFHQFQGSPHFPRRVLTYQQVNPAVCLGCNGGLEPQNFRTEEYFFNRQFSIPASQSFLANYWNPYIMRGQRYLPWAGCGGCHPASALPTPDARTPVRPYDGLANQPQTIEVPTFTGRREAKPIDPGQTGLIP